MVSTPEFKALMTAYGIKQTEMNVALDTLANLRPIEIAMQFLTTNIIMGVIFSLPIAALVRSNYKRRN